MNWCEIFKIGCHTDSQGNTHEWTEEELNTILSNFESKNPDVPITCGHVKTNSPAYGWVDKLKIEAGKLYAAFKQVQPEFEEAVKKGLFKTRSISLTPDLILRHVAFLGAQPPAIKGMEQFCFNSDENLTVIEFSENNPEDMGNGDNNSAVNAEPLGEGVLNSPPHFNEERKGIKMQDKEKQDAEFAELKNAAALKDAKIAELEQVIAENKKAAQKKEFEEFCESAVTEGRILPAQKDTVLDILFANSDTSINFDDGTSKSSNEVFMDFVKSIKQIDFSEIAQEKNVKEPETIDYSDAQAVKKTILEIQKEYEDLGVEINAAQALAKSKQKKG